MASQMHKVSGMYWMPDQELAAFLQQEPIHLNCQPMQGTYSHLVSLQNELVGGLLLVTQKYSTDGSFSETSITIITAPSLATLGQFSIADPPGIAF
jgi:hypothetical protein